MLKFHGALHTAIVLAVAGACSCHRKADHSDTIEVSLCDLRNKRELFAGKRIEVKGWVYTDEERFGLGNGDCGIGLMHSDSPLNRQRDEFIALVKKTQGDTWNSYDKVFAILRGRFETAPIIKDGHETWSPGYCCGSSPSVLVFEDVACAVEAPMSNNTMQSAELQCHRTK